MGWSSTRMMRCLAFFGRDSGFFLVASIFIEWRRGSQRDPGIGIVYIFQAAFREAKSPINSTDRATRATPRASDPGPPAWTNSPGLPPQDTWPGLLSSLWL